MSVITSSRDQLGWVATRTQALLILAYCTGAAALAGEGAVHVEEYVTLVHPVSWIGPLFLANAAAWAVTIVGLAFRPTRLLARLGGVVISALALGGACRELWPRPFRLARGGVPDIHRGCRHHRGGRHDRADNPACSWRCAPRRDHWPSHAVTLTPERGASARHREVGKARAAGLSDRGLRFKGISAHGTRPPRRHTAGAERRR
jgi:hypothetical protein